MINTEDLPVRRLAVCASGLLYWGGVMIQARRVRKQIGRSPNLKPKGPREKILWLGWFLVILVWIGQPWLVRDPAISPALALAPALMQPLTLVLGLALLVLGYVATLWTYVAMGDAWRIGINAKEKNKLVSVGPFSRIRHPIYAFQIVMLAGAALLLPTPLSFAALISHYLCAMIKAIDEERYLSGVHGETYRSYMRRTGRLFPRLTAPADSPASSIDS
jgi:protein-S-isoprenylcysteine O-methyltransferase Ste14